ncbi:MAG: tetratricopeptide repeat protein [Blastocatellia bacterium]
MILHPRGPTPVDGMIPNCWFATGWLIFLIFFQALPGQAQAVSSPEGARLEAQLRYFEALRLKAESQATRSPRLLEESVKAFEAAIRLDPQAVEPRLDLAELQFFFFSRLDLAERLGEEVLQLDPKSADGYLLLGRLLLARLRETEAEADRPALVDQAVQRFERVAELDPKRAEAWAFLAELYQMRRETDKQIAALEKWAAAPLPNDESFYRWMTDQELSPAQAHFRLAPLYLQAGRKAEALASARQAYESNPASEEYASTLVRVLAGATSLETELALYRQFTRGATGAILQLGFGGALLRAGRYEEAVLLLREVVRANPENPRSLVFLSIAQRRTGDRPAAVSSLEAALRLEGEDERRDLQLQLAETFEEMGRDEDALDRYRALFEALLSKGALTPAGQPLFEEVVSRLIRLHRRQGQSNQIEAILRQTRQALDEQNPLLDLLAVEHLREQGKDEEALARVRSASRRNPGNRSLIVLESQILASLERYDESVEILAPLVQGLPETAEEDAPIYALKGSISLQRGDLETAEQLARRAVELDGDQVGAQLLLASVRERKKEFGAAEQVLRSLIERDPGNATALNNLGYFLLERETRFEEAFSLVESALRVEPINPSFLDSLGWAHFKLGRFEEARQVLLRALIYDRRNATIHEHLGDVLHALGRGREAGRAWRTALQLTRNAAEKGRLQRKIASPPAR